MRLRDKLDREGRRFFVSGAFIAGLIAVGAVLAFTGAGQSFDPEITGDAIESVSKQGPLSSVNITLAENHGVDRVTLTYEGNTQLSHVHVTDSDRSVGLGTLYAGSYTVRAYNGAEVISTARFDNEK